MSRLDYIHEWLDTPSRSPRRGLLVFEDEIRDLLAVAEAAKALVDTHELRMYLGSDAIVGGHIGYCSRRLVAALAKLEEAAT